MSWIVQRLLMDTLRIKETHDIDSDEYNDLLIVEKKISDMKSKSMITATEDRILFYISQGYLLDDVEEFCEISRETATKIFKSLCGKIAYSLGGEFTDDGFIEDVSNRNKLSEDEQEVLHSFINSRFKHKVMRRSLKE